MTTQGSPPAPGPQPAPGARPWPAGVPPQPWGAGLPPTGPADAGWGRGPVAAHPPVVQARDRTARALATGALVVGGIALLMLLASFVMPFLLLSGLAWGMDEEWLDEGPFPASTSAFTGRVATPSDGGVSGSVLADAVVRAGQVDGPIARPASTIRCDEVEDLTPDTSVLCRAVGGERWYVVIRFTGADGGFEATVVEDMEDPW